MQYRVGVPVLFQILDGQTLKQRFFALEIGFQGRNQKALAETAGTAQEIIATCLDDVVNQIRFVHIDVTAFTDFLKILDSNRV